MYRQDKSTTERHTRILRELVKQPGNKDCADCKRNDARWASWNIGVFVCIRCSGIHRSMGTHISKVKSIDLDTWTPEQMDANGGMSDPFGSFSGASAGTPVSLTQKKNDAFGDLWGDFK
ncbi:hypothetical protein M0805_007685 [Coniferiporia weirii]|nr:hypothetical protein M0805_007685 [Coniferiporia weirii]